MKKAVGIGVVVMIPVAIIVLWSLRPTLVTRKVTQVVPTVRRVIPTVSAPSVVPIPPSKVLQSDYQAFQSFNNCGPASLSMALKYYGVTASQEEIGRSLRPYQVVSGDNDDKSVTLGELARESSKYGLVAYHRPHGSIETMRRLINAGLPVITRTWLHPNEDIGHYRVVNGYDDTTGEIIQQDSMEGKDLRYTYDTFNDIWKKYNYEYLVLAPKEKTSEIERILGADRDEQIAWRSALGDAQKQLETNPEDIHARFNASIAYFHLNNYQASVNEFEQVEARLPWRTLWYQIEPIQAYERLGNNDRVFQITDSILNNQNRSFSELYLIRGNIYKKQGNTDLARAEYEKAVFYNTSLKEARETLVSLN